jgi:hypothetical protein
VNNHFPAFVLMAHFSVSLGESQMELKDEAKLNVAIQGVWRKAFHELENAPPKNTNPSIYVAALEKLAKLADYGVSHPVQTITLFTFTRICPCLDWLLEDTQFDNVVPPIIAAVKDQSRSIQLSGLRALSKLADNGRDMFLLKRCSGLIKFQRNFVRSWHPLYPR